LVDSLSIFESNFKLTKEADKFVAIEALFWLDWNFSTNHTRRLFDEIFLELVGRDIWVAWEEELDLERRKFALAQDPIHLKVGLNQVKSIQVICDGLVMFGVHFLK
jgi:hypothetical protein